MTTYPGDPGYPAARLAPASDHRVHAVIRALRDLGMTGPAMATGVLLAAGGARLTAEQRRRVLAAFTEPEPDE